MDTSLRGKWSLFHPLICDTVFLRKITSEKLKSERRLAGSPRITCAIATLTNLHRFQELKCPFSVWNPTWDEDLCAVCRAEVRKRHEDARAKLWKKLPTALGLRPWEELDKQSYIFDS